MEQVTTKHLIWYKTASLGFAPFNHLIKTETETEIRDLQEAKELIKKHEYHATAFRFARQKFTEISGDQFQTEILFNPETYFVKKLNKLRSVGEIITSSEFNSNRQLLEELKNKEENDSYIINHAGEFQYFEENFFLI